MEYRHEYRDINQYATQLKQPEFGLRHFNHEKINAAVVHLRFKKGGSLQSGNGFFLNIPGAKQKLVLTAGHNLVSKAEHSDLEIRISGEGNYRPISNDDIRVSYEWRQDAQTDQPSEHDYGAILLPNDIEVPGDFGFSLPLSMEDEIHYNLRITGFRVDNSAGSQPTTSDGGCINPIKGKSQLEYSIETEAGLSGSPVWVGLNTQPTVVAIHTYGRTSKKRGHGSKGTRLNLKCLTDIFYWAGVNITTGFLRASGPGKSLELPLRLAYSPYDKMFRVVVNEIDDPPETMRVTIFPAYTAPSAVKTVKPGFAFMQMYARNKQHWVSWNVGSPAANAASLVDDLRKARLVRIEGKDWQSGKGFNIVARGAKADQMVTIDYKNVGESWQWEEDGESLDAISYQKYVRGKPVKDCYSQWVLEIDPSYM